jgi:hypothetical protein
MNESNFFKNFADKMGQHRYFEPTDEQWDDMHSRLNSIDRKKKRRALLFSWGVPLLLGAGVLFLGVSMQKMQRQNLHLQARILEVEQALLNQKTQHAETWVQYDTVYKTVYITKQVTSLAEHDVDEGAELMQSKFNPIQFGAFGLQRPGDFRRYDFQISQLIRSDIADDKNQNLTFLGSKSPEKVEHRRVLPERMEDVPTAKATFRKNTDYYVQKYSPKQFYGGVSYGILVPTSTESIPVHAHSTGLIAETKLTDKLRLRLETAYAPARIRINDKASDDWSLPVISPPTPDDVLDFVKVSQSMWDLSLGFKYMLGEEKPIRFYAAGAWLSKIMLDKSYQYEYLNEQTLEDTKISFSRKNVDVTTRAMQLGLGSEWRLSRRYSFGMEAVYQHQFSFSERLIGSRWGLKSNLLYAF